MIVFMNAVKEEDDRNSLARVVVMIAAEEEPVRIFRIVVPRIKGEVQERLIDTVDEFAQFCAHHRRPNQINGIWSTQISVARVRVALFLASTDHVDIDL